MLYPSYAVCSLLLALCMVTDALWSLEYIDDGDDQKQLVALQEAFLHADLRLSSHNADVITTLVLSSAFESVQEAPLFDSDIMYTAAHLPYHAVPALESSLPEPALIVHDGGRPATVSTTGREWQFEREAVNDVMQDPRRSFAVLPPLLSCPLPLQQRYTANGLPMFWPEKRSAIRTTSYAYALMVYANALLTERERYILLYKVTIARQSQFSSMLATTPSRYSGEFEKIWSEAIGLRAEHTLFDEKAANALPIGSLVFQWNKWVTRFGFNPARPGYEHRFRPSGVYIHVPMKKCDPRMSPSLFKCMLYMPQPNLPKTKHGARVVTPPKYTAIPNEIFNMNLWSYTQSDKDMRDRLLHLWGDLRPN